MSVLRLLGASAIAALIGLPSLAHAADLAPGPDSLTLAPAPADTTPAPESTQDAADANAQNKLSLNAGQARPTVPLYADAAPDAPNIHGFFEYPFKTAYVTPRGLVVENQGLVMQPVFGFVFPLDDIGPISKVAFITGLWNSINTNQHDHFVGPWNEMDYFVSITGSYGKFTGTATYSPWFFPAHAATVEETSDFKLSYNDTDTLFRGLSIKPYVDFFYDISGDSPVILGRGGSTYYFELGVSPSYTYKGIEGWPLTFNTPTYFSVGPKNFWAAHDGTSNFGTFSTAINVTVPLNMIPIRYGAWHADIGLQYFYLMNHSLVEAGGLASGNNNHNVLNASIGVGFNF
jgi:hypothetical protein